MIPTITFGYLILKAVIPVSRAMPNSFAVLTFGSDQTLSAVRRE
jgi:hypothetical protein